VKNSDVIIVYTDTPEEKDDIFGLITKVRVAALQHKIQDGALTPLRPAPGPPGKKSQVFATNTINKLRDNRDNRASKQVHEWTVEDVKEWASPIIGENFAEALAGQQIHGKALLKLDAKLLKGFGIPFGPASDLIEEMSKLTISSNPTNLSSSNTFPTLSSSNPVDLPIITTNPNNFKTESTDASTTNHRKVNRFGDGLTTISENTTSFYEPDYKPKNDIQNVLIEQVGSPLYKKALLCSTATTDTNLEVNQIAAIYIYTAETVFYPQLNQSMRSGTDWQPFQDYIYYLTETLKQLPPFNGPVYRGIDCQIPGYEVGKTIVWPAFSSSTKNPLISINFLYNKSGTIFLINGKTPREIRDYSAMKTEDEVLFLPNSTFKITSEMKGAGRAAFEAIINNGGGHLDPKTIIFELEEEI
jgi:hypothetical protein